MPKLYRLTVFAVVYSLLGASYVPVAFTPGRLGGSTHALWTPAFETQALTQALDFFTHPPLEEETSIAVLSAGGAIALDPWALISAPMQMSHHKPRNTYGNKFRKYVRGQRQKRFEKLMIEKVIRENQAAFQEEIRKIKKSKSSSVTKRNGDVQDDKAEASASPSPNRPLPIVNPPEKVNPDTEDEIIDLLQQLPNSVAVQDLTHMALGQSAVFKMIVVKSSIALWHFRSSVRRDASAVLLELAKLKPGFVRSSLHGWGLDALWSDVRRPFQQLFGLDGTVRWEDREAAVHHLLYQIKTQPLPVPKEIAPSIPKEPVSPVSSMDETVDPNEEILDVQTRDYIFQNFRKLPEPAAVESLYALARQSQLHFRFIASGAAVALWNKKSQPAARLLLMRLAHDKGRLVGDGGNVLFTATTFVTYVVLLWDAAEVMLDDLYAHRLYSEMYGGIPGFNLMSEPPERIRQGQGLLRDIMRYAPLQDLNGIQIWPSRLDTTFRDNPHNRLQVEEMIQILRERRLKALRQTNGHTDRWATFKRWLKFWIQPRPTEHHIHTAA
jgi:hypothetical protein